jgi:TolA-binding protein
MKDPDRLSDKGGDEPGADLLRSAKRYRLSEKGRQRALAAVGLAVGATAVAGGKAAAEGAAAGTKMLGWALAGFVGVAASIGGYLALAPGDKAPPPSVASTSVAPAPRARVEPAAPPAAIEAPVVPAAPNALASASPRVAPSPVGSRGVAPADLQAELTALDAASNAVARGDALRALTLLDAYGRDFPRGSLVAEATVLRAEALERAGRHADAVQLARAFVKRSPKSPLADRMRRIAGD